MVVNLLPPADCPAMSFVFVYWQKYQKYKSVELGDQLEVEGLSVDFKKEDQVEAKVFAEKEIDAQTNKQNETRNEAVSVSETYQENIPILDPDPMGPIIFLLSPLLIVTKLFWTTLGYWSCCG